ncbi:porphobilinogen synthase [Anaerobacterium chartisolvens]|uniref:Delta-aminolevulinic acid dehydratase n=1 Tax=Anaerobacterium chartisolvens TaxID=1297424 RepID=A0A369BAE6_9FIRM|nr:porphobilinogen synthase [Anaerobacterium chartisolvens]RCX17568.1 porphobilinogen synthase [Anaerobacterium chartisolvens]
MDIIKRPRRLRTGEWIRRLVRETRLSVDELIYPIFIVEGEGIKREIPSMPGVYYFSSDCLMRELEEVQSLGIPGVLLFGVTDKKDDVGSGAYDDNGVVQTALKQCKRNFPQMIFMADICLCEYTSHGHCGVVRDGHVLNDPSVELIVKAALSCADAGADVVAPSDMMDGRVGEIRKALDRNGLTDKAIMAYSAKYSSAFYGPFRDAAGSKPAFGDRRGYQMDFCNRKEALREVRLDIDEGADIIMVKPALAYLDIIRDVSERFDVPVAAYNVSGEYSMIKAAAQKGWIDERAAVTESVTAIRRAGAGIIITYFAKQLAQWI